MNLLAQIGRGHLEARVRSEVGRLAEEITARAVMEGAGVRFRTGTPVGHVAPRWVEQERVGLHDGTAGIALSLWAAHAATGDDRLLPWLKGCAHRLAERVEQPTKEGLAFAGGAAGALWVARLLSARGDCGGARLSDALAQYPRRVLAVDPASLSTSWLWGWSGVLHGLVALRGPEQALDDTWDRATRHARAALLMQLERGCSGVHGRDDLHQCGPLLGLSHGASGIGWALLEHARASGCRGSLWLALQTFRFADAQAGPRGLCADRRCSSHSPADRERLVRAFSEGDESAFEPHHECSNLSHGVAGAGLVRVRGQQLGLPGAESFVERAVAQLHARDGSRCATLAHGLAGELDFLLEAGSMPRIASGQTQIARLWRHAIAERCDALLALPSQHGGNYPTSFPWAKEQDDSLYVGKAGVLHALARLLAPGEVPSAVRPGRTQPAAWVSREDDPVHSVSGVRSTLLAQRFPRTWKQLPQAHRSQLSKRLGALEPNVDEAHSLAAVVRDVTTAEVQRAFRLETAVRDAPWAQANQAWLAAADIHRRQDREQLVELVDDALWDAELTSAPVRLLESSVSPESPVALSPGHPGGRPLSSREATLVRVFQPARNVADACRAALGPRTTTGERGAFLERVRAGLRAGHLCRPDALTTTIVDTIHGERPMTQTRPTTPESPPDFFEDLGCRLQRAFRDYRCDERRFPGLASELLADSAPHSRFDAQTLLSWAAQTTLPAQLDSFARFGNPPMTVWRCERFAIDLYPWFTSTTSIHQHGFSGAFCVLEGGSVHSRYAFDARERVNSRLLLGEVGFQGAEVLRPGDTREISPGDDFIHALFHLEHPSITLVVRTIDDPDHAPQFSYLPPGVAFDPFYGVHSRRFEILGALSEVSADAYRDATLRWFDETDLFGALLLMRTAHKHLAKQPALFEELLAALGAVFGDAGSQVAAALREEARTRAVNALRHSVKDADDRFLLALLLNVPNRAEIFRLVRQHLSLADDASVEDELARWLSRLSREAKLGFRLDDTQTDVLSLVMRRLEKPALLQALQETYETDDVMEQADAISRFVVSLRGQPLLRPLFA